MNKMASDNIFKNFPKIRNSLPESYKKIYEAEYKSNREGGTFITKITKALESWMHKKIAIYGNNKYKNHVLEIGAGTLNHLKFEKEKIIYDIIEPMSFLYEKRKELLEISEKYQTIYDITTAAQYDRIFSVAVLEHVTDLPQLIAKTCLILKKDGVFQAGIPSEGGFLWGVSWRVTTGVAYKLRHGLDYGTLMRHEHVNDAKEIEEILNYFYEDVKVSRYPLPFFHTSFYEYIEATNPKIDVAKDFINSGL